MSVLEFPKLLPLEKWNGVYSGIKFEITRYETFGVWFWGLMLILDSENNSEVEDLRAFVDGEGTIFSDPLFATLPFRNGVTHYDEVKSVTGVTRITVGTDYSGPGYNDPSRHSVDAGDLVADIRAVIDAFREKFPRKDGEREVSARRDKRAELKTQSVRH